MAEHENIKNAIVTVYDDHMYHIKAHQDLLFSNSYIDNGLSNHIYKHVEMYKKQTELGIPSILLDDVLNASGKHGD